MSETNNQNNYTMGILEWTLCALLVAIVTVTFLQVISRYVLQTSLAWTEELARYLFIWLAALGAAYAFKMRAHFLLRFVVDRCSAGAQNVIAALVAVLMIAFLTIFVWQALQYTLSVSSQTAPGTGLSKAVPASSALVGGLLMLYYVIRNWLQDIRSYQTGTESSGGQS
ncbi:MAG: TRAP transporter small permease [Woeseia sp.]|nr:TRAP transporter small permease [Woeseia sp.]